ncbi:MAG: phosphate-starvation-inducible PsiE family protein [Steroidobacteraceae bacterium]
MDADELGGGRVSRLGHLADRAFLKIEIFSYILLGVLLAVAALAGIWGGAQLLVSAIHARGETDVLVVAIDRLLFVLMVVEILRTVRVSFRTGSLVGEPFLVVGLIASIRRVLIITLESSQANQPGRWTPESQAMVHSSMLELGVLGGLILVMVISIYLLRRSRRHPGP